MAISITPKTKALTGMALAGALLLGGSGTFAWWSASADMTAGQLVSGSLTIEEATAASGWEIFEYENDTVGASLGTATVEQVKDTSKIRPGTQYVYQGTFNVVIDGHRMKGIVTADTKALLDSLKPLTDKGVKVEASAIQYRESGASGVFETATGGKLERGSYEVKAGVSVIFPETIKGSELQKQNIDLNGFKIKLLQADNAGNEPTSNI